MSKKQIILILAVTLVAILVAEMPFNHKVAEQLNVLSAYLCEQIMNGMGVLVMRHVNLVQTLVKSPPIKFDFRDGYWMLKQFYLLLPFSLLVAFYFKYPFRKIFPVGLIALLVCLFLRTLILVINASCFGQ